MDRFHVHLRAVAAALLLSGCTCADRPLTEEDHPLTEEDPSAREAACMWIIGPVGYFADGSKRVIADESISRAGTVCLCLTEQEYDEQLRHDEMNGMALQECKRLASQHDFVRDECQEHYDQGEWLNDVFWAKGNKEEGAPPGFSCE